MRFQKHTIKNNNMRKTGWIALTMLLLSGATALAAEDGKAKFESDALAGQPADIALSAYQYRADRKPEENSPESWLALMNHAGMPLNKPVDVNAPAIKRVLCALLWEEIRPIHRVELIWAANAKNRPRAEELIFTTLDNQGTASLWWNNLKAVQKPVTPTVSGDGRIYVCDLTADTCGLVIGVSGDKAAAEYAAPTVRVLVADTWKTMDFEIEWGFEPGSEAKDYSGRMEIYDGRLAGLAPLDRDTRTAASDATSWTSTGGSAPRRGVKASLLYMGTSKWRKTIPFTSQVDDVARTIVTVWTQSGNFSFLAADLENGPILAPEYGFFVRRTSALRTKADAGQPPIGLDSQAASAREFIKELASRKLRTIRQQTRVHEEQTWEGAVTGIQRREVASLPPHPKPPAGSEPPMRVEVPCERLTAQWNLGAWHLLRHCGKNPKNGRLWFNDHVYGILAAETYIILAALDVMGSHQAAADGFDQWVSLPMQPRVEPGREAIGDWKPDKQHPLSLPDRPVGNFSDGLGCLTLAEGAPGFGGHMDGVHAYGPGCIGWALTEHYRMTGDREWLKASAPRIQANAEWMLRQRRVVKEMVPGGERLWCKGLQPAHQATPDSGGLFLQWYWSEAYYCASVSRWAATLGEIDPDKGAKLAAEAEAYRKDLLTAAERSIALSPVVQVRDGTYHSVIPFGCYMRGLGTGAWGWQRDGSVAHWGPLTFETDLSAIPLMGLDEIFSPDDARIQGYLDVLEDRLLVDNPRTGSAPWFLGGWQHQVGIQKTIEAHLACDDIPVFLRAFLNSYAIHIVPNDGYFFNEHVFGGPHDKIFEDAAFLYRFRNLLVMEDNRNLWLARATPRAWLEQGKKISVKNAPTHFGVTTYEIVSDVDHGKISATVEMPSRKPPKSVLLRFRHPKAAPIKSVTVDGKEWTAFDKDKETVELKGLAGTVAVMVNY